MSQYISLKDGSPYPKPIPTCVTVPRSMEVGEDVLVKMTTYCQDEPDYAVAVEHWLFMQGYVRADKAGPRMP